jgi:hypothetical protein
MSQHIDYANRAAQRPGLGPLTSTDREREVATKNRAWASVPFSISLTVHLIFLLYYWLPEMNDFPGNGWWVNQLGPLASPWLTSRGEAQVSTQPEFGVASAVMLLAAFLLVCLSRSRRWWGRVAILVPAAVGGLAGLGILVGLLSTGGNRTSTLSVMLLLLWLAVTGYVAAAGFQDRLGSPPPKTWRSGLPALVGYALIGPLPLAVGRALFAPDLRDQAYALEGNTEALRLAALVTASTAWLYLSGLLVGVSLWVLYRWWPLRRGNQVIGVLVAMAVMLVITSGFGWTAARLASVRTTQLALGSPAGEPALSCGAWAQPRESAVEPVLTLGVTGAECRTVTIFEGYRQLSTGTVPISLSPIEAKTPENRPILSEQVGALYGEIVVVAATNRLDRAPISLLGLRITDGSQAWEFSCPDPLTVRFSLVEPNDDPAQGHITEEGETVPQVLVGCGGKTSSLNPQNGRPNP